MFLGNSLRIYSFIQTLQKKDPIRSVEQKKQKLQIKMQQKAITYHPDQMLAIGMHEQDLLIFCQD